jgi:hypothetical protein
MFRFLCSLLLLVVGGALVAQESGQFAAGLVLDDAAYDTLPRQAVEDGAKSALPAAVDLTPYCPEVRHQGYIHSCVGWAVGYGALTIQRAILNECTDRAVITQQAHSALFVYNQVKGADCSAGARLSDALRLLATRGDCLASEFDFEVNDCEQRPDSAVERAARRYAIEDFLTLFGSAETPEEKVRRVRILLARRKPVVAGMLVLRNFYELQQAVYWHPDLGNTTPAGGHALVVVGYDDRRQAFRLMNSWGANWGDGGYIWIKYRDFGRFCKYAYALYLLAPAALPAADTAAVAARPLERLAGALELRHLTGWQEHSGQPLFEAVAVSWNGAGYRVRREDWTTGQLFQLLASARQEDEYLYVFSVDAQRKVHFHWPRAGESGLLLAGQADVVLPGERKALRLEHVGTDRLVALYAKRRIETVGQLAELVSRQDGDLATNLWRTLGRHAVPAADVRFERDRVGFEAATWSEGFIVPVVLEVPAR